MDFSDLEQKLKNPQTTLMILCNPHNPVGKIWDNETLARVGDLCHRYGVTVISDEIHCSLTTPGKSYIPFASVNETCQEVSVSCVAASKAFNLAGLQSACVYAKNPILRHKVWRGINTDEVGEPNAFAMRANIAAYKYGGAWLDGLNAYIYENKKYAVDFINQKMPKLKVKLSDATYLLWVCVSEYSKNSKEFTEELRRESGLYISPGVEYGKCGDGFVRINLATQRENVVDGMQRLYSYIKMLDEKAGK